MTVHTTDDEAEQIWRDAVGMPAERIQRLGDDNFWRMADTGPCGPSSEIFWDLGPDHGPDLGPAGNEDRYVEIWNLVFMQFDAKPDGELVPLPAPSVDTGAGLERNLAVLQGVESLLGHRRLPAPARGGRGRHRRRATAASRGPTPTCRCASSPSTGAR